MAIYAADIQINVKNKGDLKKLENRFEKLTKSSIKLEKTLKNLGKRNAIRVDTRAAMSAISALEARIRGLNRTVRVDARTSGGGGDSGGMSGAAMPMMASFWGKGRSSARLDTARFDAKKDLLGISDEASDNLLNRLIGKEKEYSSLVQNSSGVINRSRKAQTEALKDLNKHEEIRVPLYEKVNTAIKNQASLNRKNMKGSGGLIDQIKNLGTLATALTTTSFESGFRHQKKHLIDRVKLKNDELRAAKKVHQTNLDDLEVIRKRIEVAKDPSQVMEALTLSKRDLDLNKQLNEALTTAAEKAGNLVSAQSKFTKETAKGGSATKGTIDGLREAEEAARRAATEVRRLHKDLATPVKGGFLQQIGFGFKGLGAKGALGSMGKGMAGASALIPGVAPFALGAGIGQAGKTGGQAVAGGIMGAVGAGAVMGTMAFLKFAKSATVVASEMDRMRTALSGVVPDQESYNTSLEKVSKLSDKYGISQRTLLKGFTQLQASADAAGFDVKETGDLMEGLLTRTLASGKGLEEFKGVMLAASQILSKGKLQAEEARGQIGERIPGFMADLAASMNIEMKQLDKLMEQGQVTLEDFFKLGEDLLKNNEKIALVLAQSYANAGQRLTTAMENLQAAMGPGLSIAGAQFQSFAANVINGLTEMAKAANAKELERLEKILDRIKKGGIQGKLMEWTHGSKDKIEEQRSIISGEKDIDERAKREKAIKEAQDNANWEQIKRRLEIDIQYSKDKIELGEKEAEIKRKLAELELQFPDREDSDKADIKQLLKDLQQTEVDLRFDDAKKGFEEEIKYLEEKLNLGTKQADKNKELRELTKDMNEDQKKALEDQIDKQEKLNEALDGELITRGKIVDILDDYEDKLKELMNPLNQIKDASDAIGSAFGDAVRDVVSGTKSIGDAVVSMLDRIAAHFLDKAAEMMATQASNWLFKSLSSAFGGGAQFGNIIGNTSMSSAVSWSSASSGGFPSISFSSGGYVDRPTKGLIGEAGEGEYVIKESQMAGAMNRWSQGNRGKAVIHGSDGGVGSNQAGGSTELVVNYTGPSLVFNEQEYVPKSAVPEIINSAARRGAEAGQSKVLSQLKNSRSQRARLGL